MPTQSTHPTSPAHDALESLLNKLEQEYLTRLRAYALEDYDYYETYNKPIQYTAARPKHDDGAAG